ncbi:hypothetical protein TNCV_3657641 [Trichonephila clavipes]|nr:hypothetical protein TNCV_3657641 [Trichonephila clavipes]
MLLLDRFRISLPDFLCPGCRSFESLYLSVVLILYFRPPDSHYFLFNIPVLRIRLFFRPPNPRLLFRLRRSQLLL